MGIVRADLRLSNPLKQNLNPISVSALADTGALHLCIPEHVVLQLVLRPLSFCASVVCRYDSEIRSVREKTAGILEVFRGFFHETRRNRSS
jgi:hypothetical protein